MLTAANGAYNKTVVVREVDDTYIFIKNCTVERINRKDFLGFNEIIERNQTKNIVIDGRLDTLIYYSILEYYDNILIYSITDKKIHTVYNFIASVYKVPLSQLTLNRVRIWACILYISCVCLNDILDIRPGELLKYIISNNCSKNRVTFNYLIDTVNNHSTETINKVRLKKVHDYMIKMITAFNNRRFITEPVDEKLLNAYHIKSILDVLYSNRFVIDL
jgi:hypothetical protein